MFRHRQDRAWQAPRKIEAWRHLGAGLDSIPLPNSRRSILYAQSLYRRWRYRLHPVQFASAERTCKAVGATMTLSLLTWDFDHRLPSLDQSQFVTWSIAIFQWQPKSSGKGLKKVHACRVHGYAMDAHALQTKAEEICDRLNRERASVTNLPIWLRKHYSVPKPPELVIPNTQTDLPGSVVRSVRSAVMKRLLIPEGFVRGRAGTYVRRHENQIHLIDFQPARFGHQYTINLGLHYTFLQPLSARRKIPLASYHQLDCGLLARIGQLVPGGRDRWFSYGDSRDKLMAAMEGNAKLCLRIIDREARRFAEPRELLSRQGCQIEQKKVEPWDSRNELFAIDLALHLGRDKCAIRELRRLLVDASSWQRGVYGKLLRRALRRRQ
ncbi:MAG: DUF4304 domain-containing protein [Pirellulaceae bacterium]|nr:DUF4304 domain-containing protein [Pirellulaceae bacterium]